MAKKEVKIRVTADNQVASGLNRVRSAMAETFAKIGVVTRSILGPVAMVTAAMMGIGKAAKWVAEAMNRQAASVRKIQLDNLTGQVDALKTAYENINKETKTFEDRLTDESKAIARRVEANDRLVESFKELQKQKALANLAPDDEAGRQEVEMRFKSGTAESDAVNQARDIQAKIEEAEKKAAARRTKAGRLSALMEEQRLSGRDALAKSEAAVAQAEKKRRGFTMLVAPGVVTAIEDDARAYAKAAQDLLKQQRTTSDEMEKAVQEEAGFLKEAAALRIELEAAKVAAVAKTAEATTEATIKAATVQATATADAQKKALAWMEQTEKELADIDKRITENMRGELTDRISMLENEQAKKEALAARSIQSIIDEAKAGEDAGKQSDRDWRKATELRNRMARGAKLGKKSQDWLNAFDQIERAKIDVVGLDAAAEQAKKQLDALQDQLKALDQLHTDLGQIKDALTRED